jgi:hypothetical protein
VDGHVRRLVDDDVTRHVVALHDDARFIVICPTVRRHPPRALAAGGGVGKAVEVVEVVFLVVDSGRDDAPAPIVRIGIDESTTRRERVRRREGGTF